MKSFTQFNKNKSGMNIKEIQTQIDLLKKHGESVKNISDTRHSFKELYEYRKVYNALLFNEWFKSGKYSVHKSKLHNDGGLPFGKNNYFIVCAKLPDGLISNHYKIEDWELFQCQETEKALFEFDGHTPIDVLERMKSLIKK